LLRGVRMKKRPFVWAAVFLLAVMVLFVAVVLVVGKGRGATRLLAGGDKIAVVEVLGPIVTARDTIDKLDEFAEDRKVRAIVIRIDSPGGSVGPSQEIHDAVKRIGKKKPVYVSMGSVAASGGYYIAVAADKIFANPGTLTGSIGVIMEFTNVMKLMNKIGLKSRVIKSGVHKDIGSPMREMTAEEKKLLQELIDDVYGQFVGAVSAGRHLPEKRVRALADGRIYTGRQAKELGLIDELGGLHATIAAVAKRVGISGKPEVVYPEKPRGALIDYFVEKSLSHLQQLTTMDNGAAVQLMWRPTEN